MQLLYSDMIDEILFNYQKENDELLELFYSSCAMREKFPEAYSEKMHYIFVEHILLTAYKNWEFFIENIFIRYMLGDSSKEGNPVHRFVYPKDEEHAYKMIKNVRLYPDWSDINAVTTYAENFFEEGGAFAYLRTMKGELYSIKKIRNAIAHNSLNAKREFENLVLGKIGFLPNNITPANFLANYKMGKKKTDVLYIEHYIDYLKNAAELLAQYNTRNTI